MTDTKHTPGNWKCEYGNPPMIISENEDEITYVADVFGDDYTETLANARLIAAAPEMLELLERLVEICDPECCLAHSIGEDADRLIAKAKGETE